MSCHNFSKDLQVLLRKMRLSPMLETMPERLLLARERKLSYEEFLEVIMSDEVERRSRISTSLRVKKAKLDPAMSLESWDSDSGVSFDRQLWAELQTLRFLEEHHNVLLLGPVGVGKTFMANALGHIACRRGYGVLMLRTETMLKELKASRLDRSFDQEMRRLIGVDLLALDDFGLDQLDPVESRDLYELILERHIPLFPETRRDYPGQGVRSQARRLQGGEITWEWDKRTSEGGICLRSRQQ